MESAVKIPTLLGLGVLLVAVAVGVFLVTQPQYLFTQANPSTIPNQITVSNISFDSFSISWQTDNPITGYIQLGTSAHLGQTFRDDRDEQNPSPHLLHFVTVKGLSPNTVYYYKINSGKDSYPEKPLIAMTSSVVSSANNPSLIGTIVDSNLQIASETLVYMQIPKAQMLATITKVAGNFILPTSILKTEDLTASFNYQSSSDPAKLLLIGPGSSSTVTIYFPLSNPILPPLTLGKDSEILMPFPTNR